MAKREKEIRRIEIEPAENGGHTVTHHFKERPTHSSKHGMGMEYTAPEQHVFGPEDGHLMLAHVANHLHIPKEAPGEEESEGKGEAEPEGEEEE